ncbi:hypothetical protein ABIF63_005769 [Bradyrhizobium japonicum]|uniref:Transposase n=1 Tax=Bradyrhizobium japonicum TaxID=375 RepID=A0ABV2RXK4_BRAJP|nr:hypothetical protein [Bradyrhizobium japonicum]UQD95240.1 hypothetical protein JEY30_26840 [Bradyrhizobium japonicum]WLB23447.1 hypothetical protein QIH95_22405 [Bradyrhizobium japonicum]
MSQASYLLKSCDHQPGRLAPIYRGRLGSKISRVPSRENDQMARFHHEAFFPFSTIRDLVSKRGIKIGKRVERLHVRQNLRKLQSCVDA